MKNILKTLMLSMVMVLTLSGCGTLKDIMTPAGTELAIRYSTMKVIEAADDSSYRAGRVIEITDAILSVTESSITASIPELKEITMSYIDWDSLSPADAMMIRMLVGTIGDELQRKLNTDVLDENQKIRIVYLITIVRDTASMMYTSE